MRDNFYLCWKSRGANVVPSPNCTEVELYVYDLGHYSVCKMKPNYDEKTPYSLTYPIVSSLTNRNVFHY